MGCWTYKNHEDSMPFENTCKLEKNFMQLSETQNNKQINYDPDYSLNSALPLTFLVIHWHQGMFQCRGRNRDILWWWSQILLRPCQSRCNPFLLSVHVWVPEIQLSNKCTKRASPIPLFWSAWHNHTSGKFFINPVWHVSYPVNRIISKRHVLCILADIFILLVVFFKFLPFVLYQLFSLNCIYSL